MNCTTSGVETHSIAATAPATNQYYLGVKLEYSSPPQQPPSQANNQQQSPAPQQAPTLSPQSSQQQPQPQPQQQQQRQPQPASAQTSPQLQARATPPRPPAPASQSSSQHFQPPSLASAMIASTYQHHHHHHHQQPPPPSQHPHPHASAAHHQHPHATNHYHPAGAYPPVSQPYASQYHQAPQPHHHHIGAGVYDAPQPASPFLDQNLDHESVYSCVTTNTSYPPPASSAEDTDSVSAASSGAGSLTNVEFCQTAYSAAGVANAASHPHQYQHPAAASYMSQSVTSNHLMRHQPYAAAHHASSYSSGAVAAFEHANHHSSAQGAPIQAHQVQHPANHHHQPHQPLIHQQAPLNHHHHQHHHHLDTSQQHLAYNSHPNQHSHQHHHHHSLNHQHKHQHPLLLQHSASPQLRRTPATTPNQKSAPQSVAANPIQPIKLNQSPAKEQSQNEKLDYERSSVPIDDQNTNGQQEKRLAINTSPNSLDIGSNNNASGELSNVMGIGSTGGGTASNSNAASTSGLNSTGGRSKRLRTSFKPHQMKEMRAWFKSNQNPDAKDLKILAEKTGLTKRVLQVWFQNARAKFRRNNAKAASQQLYDVDHHTSHMLQFQRQHHHLPHG